MAKKHDQLVTDLINGLKNGVVRELVEECGKNEKDAKQFVSHVDLPSGETAMRFARDGDTIRVIMSMEGAGSKNMQADDAAFEGWALVLHVHLGKNVFLELDMGEENAVSAWDPQKPHYNRFLYRLKKFHDLYGGSDGWFTIREDLAAAMEEFDRYLHTPGQTFYNNVASNPAGVSKMESMVEDAFASHPEYLSAYSGNLFRQLPVGLFDGAINIFTGGKSAIDLWGLNENASGTQLVIYELKAQNKQIGIISELMFYSNYVYDLYVERKNFKPSEPPMDGKDHRGYEQLYEQSEGGKITDVRAYMLTDKLHPLITPKVLGEMKKREGIQYGVLEYQIKEIIISPAKESF